MAFVAYSSQFPKLSVMISVNLLKSKLVVPGIVRFRSTLTSFLPMSNMQDVDSLLDNAFNTRVVGNRIKLAPILSSIVFAVLATLR